MNPSAAQAAGMAGNEELEQVVAYLTQLTGELVSADRPVRLRSIQRAAFTSWVRKSNLTLRTSLLTSGAFTVSDMFAAETSTTLPTSEPAVAAVSPVAAGEIGIDIQEFDSLPSTSDYREHPFYQERFTPAEIAYCVRQHEPEASFCELWAAKEAILKSGLLPTSTRMDAFAITHDQQGGPVFPGCRLAISHASKVAVAVCVVSLSPAPAQPTPLLPPMETVAIAVAVTAPRKRWPWSRT